MSIVRAGGATSWCGNLVARPKRETADANEISGGVTIFPAVEGTMSVWLNVEVVEAIAVVFAGLKVICGSCH